MLLVRLLGWLRRHPFRSSLIAAIAAVLMLNIMAFMHAWSMTHFVVNYGRPAQEKEKVESLSPLSKAWLLVAGVKVNRPHNRATPKDLGLPFEVHRFPTANGGECESWHVPCDGAKNLCILFHGYAGCKSGLLSEAAALHELGFATLLVDFRGSGGSSGNTTTIGYREADDVLAAVRYAQDKLDPQPPILYGQSMGSAAILRAVAALDVKPRALIIECPFDRLLTTVEHRFEAVGIPSFPSAELLVFWGSVQQGHWAFGHNPIDSAPRVTCPVLMMHGAKDPRVTLAEAESILASLRGPKQLVVFPELGHGFGLGSDITRWKQAVGEFLAGL